MVETLLLNKKLDTRASKMFETACNIGATKAINNVNMDFSFS